MSLNKNITDKNKSDISEIEKDDRDIKSQLKASLDFKSISISEELINRTLEAIRQQETVPQGHDELKISGQNDNSNTHLQKVQKTDKKVITWFRYARIIAGAAAAVFVIAVGMNSIGGLNKSEKDMGTSLLKEDTAGNEAGEPSVVTPQAGVDDNTQVNDTSSASASKSESVPDRASASKAENKAKSQKNSAKTSKKDSDTSSDYSDSDQMTADNTENSDPVQNSDKASDSSQNDKNKTVRADLLPNDTADAADTVDDSKNAESNELVGSVDNSQMLLTTPTNTVTYLNFQNIFLTEPQKADYIKITNEADNTSILLTGQDIQYFYTVMGQYKFTNGTQAPTSLKYTIIAVNEQSLGQTYTMSVGDSINVNYKSGNVNTDSFYDTSDTTRMIADLGALFLKYDDLK